MCATADLKVNTACHCRKALLDGDQLVQVAIVVDVLASLERLLVEHALQPSSLSRFAFSTEISFCFLKAALPIGSAIHPWHQRQPVHVADEVAERSVLVRTCQVVAHMADALQSGRIARAGGPSRSR